MPMKRRRYNQNPVESLEPSDITPYSPEKQVDIKGQAQAYEPSKPGIPPTDAIIFSGFDARPIAGEDFLSQGLMTFSNSDQDPTTTNALGAFFNFSVPNGYRAILRTFRYEFEPAIAQEDINDILATLATGGPAYINGINPGNGGSNVQGFTRMPLGSLVVDPLPCYVISDSKQNITLILEWVENILTIINSSGCVIMASLYGNLLIDTGVATNFQPGTSPAQLAKIKDLNPK